MKTVLLVILAKISILTVYCGVAAPYWTLANAKLSEDKKELALTYTRSEKQLSIPAEYRAFYLLGNDVIYYENKWHKKSDMKQDESHAWPEVIITPGGLRSWISLLSQYEKWIDQFNGGTLKLDNRFSYNGVTYDVVFKGEIERDFIQRSLSFPTGEITLHSNNNSTYRRLDIKEPLALLQVLRDSNSFKKLLSEQLALADAAESQEKLIAMEASADNIKRQMDAAAAQREASQQAYERKIGLQKRLQDLFKTPAMQALSAQIESFRNEIDVLSQSEIGPTKRKLSEMDAAMQTVISDLRVSVYMKRQYMNAYIQKRREVVSEYSESPRLGAMRSSYQEAITASSDFLKMDYYEAKKLATEPVVW